MNPENLHLINQMIDYTECPGSIDLLMRIRDDGWEISGADRAKAVIVFASPGNSIERQVPPEAPSGRWHRPTYFQLRELEITMRAVPRIHISQVVYREQGAPWLPSSERPLASREQAFSLLREARGDVSIPTRGWE